MSKSITKNNKFFFLLLNFIIQFYFKQSHNEQIDLEQRNIITHTDSSQQEMDCFLLKNKKNKKKNLLYSSSFSIYHYLIPNHIKIEYGYKNVFMKT